MSERRIVWSFRILAGVAWLAIIATAALGLTAVTAALGALAITATILSVFYDELPRPYDAWHMGIEYGRERERTDIELGRAPDPLGPGLRVVRTRR